MQSHSEAGSEKRKQRSVQLIDNGLKFVLRDLSILQDRSDSLPMSFPQILLVFSGIEFVSALLYSEGSYTDRVDRYISDWMPANYSRNEGETTLGRFLYDSLRSGLVHYGNVKGDIVVDHDEEAGLHHLMWVPYRGRYRLFIHGNVLARHFVESLERLKDGIANDDVSIIDIQSNAETLERKLERSLQREPNKTRDSRDERNCAQRAHHSQQHLPDSTRGTTYESDS